MNWTCQLHGLVNASYNQVLALKKEGGKRGGGGGEKFFFVFFCFFFLFIYYFFLFDFFMKANACRLESLEC